MFVCEGVCVCVERLQEGCRNDAVCVHVFVLVFLYTFIYMCLYMYLRGSNTSLRRGSERLQEGCRHAGVF